MTIEPAILEHVGVTMSCHACGGHYVVPLTQIVAAQELVHESERMWDEGCPNYCRDATCEPLVYASLMGEDTARDALGLITDAIDRLDRAGVDVDLSCR